MDKPDMSLFTGSENFGNVFLERMSINVKSSDFSVPFTSTAGNISVNWKGKIRLIVIQGSHDGTGFTGATQEERLKAFVDTMELEWIDENIVDAVNYTDTFSHEYSVMPIDWTWTRSVNRPNTILYTLLMKRAN